MVISYQLYMSNSPAVLINTIVLSSERRLLPQHGVVSQKLRQVWPQVRTCLIAPTQPLRVRSLLLLRLILSFTFVKQTVPRRHLGECEASRRHLEECSVCSRQTSSLTSENSQVPSSQIEPNPEWPAPVFRLRPQFFQSDLTEVSRPCTRGEYFTF